MKDPLPNTLRQRMLDLISSATIITFFIVFFGTMLFAMVALVVEAWDTPSKPLNDDYMWERRDWDTTYGYYPEEIRQEMRKRYELHKKHEQMDEEVK